MIFSDDNIFEHVKLRANDISAYHRIFTTPYNNEEKQLKIFVHNISYKSVEELPVKVNTVRCSNLSVDFFWKNYINVTASFFRVNFRTDYLFQVYVDPHF